MTVHFELHNGYRYGILLPVPGKDFIMKVLDFYAWFFIWKPYDKTLENRKKKFSLRINLDKIISPIISQSKWSDQNDLNNNLIWPILKNVLTLMSLWNNRLFDDVFIKWPLFENYSSILGTSETFCFSDERKTLLNVPFSSSTWMSPFFYHQNLCHPVFVRGRNRRKKFYFWSPTKQD